ncbi:MAG: type I glyceraldehyde-3-phosphate dehydrogenase [Candidatus Pacebacteria bacterium]|nr:type I glyceraldehyde-3-phosphate dehydrogenase [Candidatus Paceibacterota bacterium]MCD8528284.1 type I glyceraldehyde-3-phosphate dehydrogenase [Candidatus Paceibacterota bacterium]MCD8563973.1 type I glyceraldehyde-3-phosphate dehydrogenase [Candidatus Paceibacterota bacterium]
MEKSIQVGINGFGRIGRAFLKLSLERDDIDVIAINDLGDIENLAYLLRYDTAYGPADFMVDIEGDELIITTFFDDHEAAQQHRIKVFKEMNPQDIPWGKAGVDVVVESTGIFTTYDKAALHLQGGARKVVISAPAKEEDGATVHGETVLMGINTDALATCDVSSNGSCTTNAGSPLMAILDEKIGIEKAILNTVHAYTATQAIVDGPAKKDFRGGRAAAQNIIPSSTGAAIAVTKVLPQLAGKFDGISLRVPVVAGSIVDITFIAKRPVTRDEVNQILTDAAEEDRWQGIFTVTEEPLVSTDILGSSFASIADLEMTRVVDGNLVKVLAWYDNEMGYTHTLIEHVVTTMQK